MNVRAALGQVRQAAQAAPLPTTPRSAGVTALLPVPSAGRVVRSGVAAGATVVALSVVSAMTSRVRRRMEGP